MTKKKAQESSQVTDHYLQDLVNEILENGKQINALKEKIKDLEVDLEDASAMHDEELKENEILWSLIKLFKGFE